MAGYIGSKIAVTQVDGYNRTEADAEFVNDPNTVITVSGSNVGIGTSSPSHNVHVSSSGGSALALTAGSSDNAQIRFGDSSDDDAGKINYDNSTNHMAFHTNASERCRIDSSGNLLVGKTSSSFGATGIELKADNQFRVTRSGVCASLNRLSTDGVIADFYGPSGLVGAIGNNGPRMFIGTADTGLFFADDLDSVTPWNPSTNGSRDNAIDLGWASGRFDDIYATNGTIQTSDINEKQDIEALSDAEQRVAVAAKGLLRKYRWKDAVAEKGDAARIHFGIIAQDLQAAFEAEGLDAGRYGMFISSTWWEAEVEKTREVEQEDGTTITETYTVTETYDEPTEGATERTRLGVRYPELLAFIIAAL